MTAFVPRTEMREPKSHRKRRKPPGPVKHSKDGPDYMRDSIGRMRKHKACRRCRKHKSKCEASELGVQPCYSCHRLEKEEECLMVYEWPSSNEPKDAEAPGQPPPTVASYSSSNDGRSTTQLDHIPRGERFPGDSTIDDYFDHRVALWNSELEPVADYGFDGGGFSTGMETGHELGLLTAGNMLDGVSSSVLLIDQRKFANSTFDYDLRGIGGPGAALATEMGGLGSSVDLGWELVKASLPHQHYLTTQTYAVPSNGVQAPSLGQGMVRNPCNFQNGYPVSSELCLEGEDEEEN